MISHTVLAGSRAVATRRPLPSDLCRFFRPDLIRHASARAPVIDKSRILEKPTRFNPPSHGARRVVRPRSYPGPRLSEQEKLQQQSRRYPNTMPAEGTFMYSFLTDRRVHLFITLGTLFTLAAYSMASSFYQTTIYRDQLPAWGDLLNHPFRTMSQFFSVYKLHVAYETEQVAEKRRLKLEDASKRQEFLREHGVEPGFLTGSWMDKFGTVEGDRWRAERHKKKVEDSEASQSPLNPSLEATTALAAGSAGASELPQLGTSPNESTESPKLEKKKKVKMWFGIW